MKKIRNIENLPIDSTRLCCNFVNTVYAWKGDDDYDFLTDYDVFIDWCIKLSVANKGELANLRAHATANPGEAAAAMVRIRKIRLLIHDFISAIANNDRKEMADLLEKINPLIADALCHIHLEFSTGRFAISYPRDPVKLVSPVWVIVKSLYDLITTEPVGRIKECPSCGWVFYDETKNGKRRWCNPLNCGTKDKMSRYNQRKRQQDQ